MKRRHWLLFAATQSVGIALNLCAMSFQVGVGGWREFLWFPATLMLFPGILLGYAAGAFNFSDWLGGWYATPLFATAVLINAACWRLSARVLRKHRCEPTPKASIKSPGITGH